MSCKIQLYAKLPISLLSELFIIKKDNHDKALIIAAIMVKTNKPPELPDTPLMRSLTTTANLMLSRARAEPEPLQRKSEPGLVTDYEIVPPSDQARKENAEYRKQHGLTHIGPRFLRPDQGHKKNELPLHWGANMLRGVGA